MCFISFDLVSLSLLPYKSDTGYWRGLNGGEQEPPWYKVAISESTSVELKDGRVCAVVWVTADAEDKTRRKARLRLIREGPQGRVKKDPTSGGSLINGEYL